MVFVSSLTYASGYVEVVDKDHLEVDEDHYGRFTSYSRSKYLLTSYALHFAKQHPSIFVGLCDPGIASTNIARELGFIGKLYSLPFFKIFFPTQPVCKLPSYADL